MLNVMLPMILLIIFANLNDPLWIVYIGDICLQNCQQQRHATVTIALALATFCGATQIESFLSETFALPKGFHLNYLVLQAILRAILSCFCHQCKHCFKGENAGDSDM